MHVHVQRGNEEDYHSAIIARLYLTNHNTIKTSLELKYACSRVRKNGSLTL